MKKHEYYTYILLCNDDSLYVGMTNNLERRFKEHSEGVNSTAYTHSRRPLKLVHVEKHDFVDEAIEREKRIKNWPRKKKEALINRKAKQQKGFRSETA